MEAALAQILRHPVDVVGCGRTDAGVHARYYVAHFDSETALPPNFLNGLNALLGPDIAVHGIQPVSPQAHARFDAYERSYAYYIALRKDPFAQDTAWFYPQHSKLEHAKMAEVAALLPRYEAFFPFCKTHSGVDSYACQLKSAHWEYLPEQHRLIFHISANRFLRGMVRLIVGACIQAARGQVPVEAVQAALDTQSPLPKSLSVPPQGLFLTDVRYSDCAD
jgi:tRNA pseudouridine38-40 synthase